MAQLLDSDVIVSIKNEDYLSEVSIGKHRLVADEPESKGGQDKGPNPYEMLLASLGSCTVITLRMYAQNKKWEIGTVQVKLNLEQVQRESEKITVIRRKIHFSENLESDKKDRLLAVAKACPVAKIISGTVEIDSALED
ncbi:MAG TPA: OsmC family protein [Leptospiraceae bacterium]|nr:OsmC family protein [Leptospiraceae bacterium]HMW08180.1 OsmC family protein [Leptospiraceae bacterium]HMX35269.1 OsmC family protein [Leptospiraceae bacterium]HMY33983.1 OsmC family protein [Leptospiraceae bacterium]HMZ66509.1 OsmC family protein [Leptospiraceae bacterium]